MYDFASDHTNFGINEEDMKITWISMDIDDLSEDSFIKKPDKKQ